MTEEKTLAEIRDEKYQEHLNWKDCTCAEPELGDCVYHDFAYDFNSGFDAGVSEMKDRAEVLVEAMEMGAFHHSSCNANFYEDGTIRKDFNGYGDERDSKPCTCAHYKIDLAIETYRKSIGDGE